MRSKKDIKSFKPKASEKDSSFASSIIDLILVCPDLRYGYVIRNSSLDTIENLENRVTELEFKKSMSISTCFF